MYSRAMSSSYCQVKKLLSEKYFKSLHFRQTKQHCPKLSTRNWWISEVWAHRTSSYLILLRFLDRWYIEINALYIQVTSPYVSLEMLDEPDYKAIARHRSPNHRIYSSDSSSDSSTGIQMMTKPKLLKRPRRTATSVVRGRLTKSTSVDKVSNMNLQYSYKLFFLRPLPTYKMKWVECQT